MRTWKQITIIIIMVNLWLALSVIANQPALAGAESLLSPTPTGVASSTRNQCLTGPGIYCAYLPLGFHTLVCEPPAFANGEYCVILIPPVVRPTPVPGPGPDVEPTPTPTATPWPEPPVFDSRFGFAEYSRAEIAKLGFDPDGVYWSIQWQAQDVTAPALFIRAASRPHLPSQWCMVAWRVSGMPDYCVDPTGATLAMTTGWVNEILFRRFVRDHPGKMWHIGNEPLCSLPSCDDGGLSLHEYARWYGNAWRLIKAEDTTALVGFGLPIGWTRPERTTINMMWDFYQGQWGELMPADFIPVHHYAVHGLWTIQSEIEFFERDVGWLETMRGVRWQGPRRYILNEFGMLSWKYDIPMEEQMRYMAAVMPYLQSQDLIHSWAWWPAWNPTCTDLCGKLLDWDGNPTPLGELYISLASGE